jgi:hypothetical protein
MFYSIASASALRQPCAWGGVREPTPGMRQRVKLACRKLRFRVTNNVLIRQAKIVCGAANNQLLDPRDDAGMFHK